MAYNKNDKHTEAYRKAEIAALGEVVDNCQYNPSIKLTTPTGQTKYLGISWEELAQIKAILLKAE